MKRGGEFGFYQVVQKLGVSLVAVSLVGCMLEEAPPVSETVQYVRKDCETYGCGTNSPEAGGKLFWELNERGLPNNEGIHIVEFEKWGVRYRPDVVNGRLLGRDLTTGAVTLTNVAGANFLLEDAETGRQFNVEVASFTTMPMWARPQAQGAATPSTYDYKLFYSSPDGEKRNLCNAALDSDTFSAVLFDDDRIDPDNLRVYAQQADWFTIGCARSALAKQHLSANTKAGANAIGRNTTSFPMPTLGERTAWLKMLTADYCGTGVPFTVAGVELHYKDVDGAMNSAPTTFSWSTKIEALWTENGATCLNTPRVELSSLDLAGEVFGDSIDDELASPESGCTPQRLQLLNTRCRSSFGLAYAMSANY